MTTKKEEAQEIAQKIYNLLLLEEIAGRISFTRLRDRVSTESRIIRMLPAMFHNGRCSDEYAYACVLRRMVESHYIEEYRNVEAE